MHIRLIELDAGYMALALVDYGVSHLYGPRRECV